MIYPQPIQQLIDLFTKFPGIGPRQAGRFVFFLLKEETAFTHELAEALAKLHERIRVCTRCFRTTESDHSKAEQGTILCSLCSGGKRNSRIIAIVEKEADLQGVEKTGVFEGLYHVLGGVISPIDQDSPKRLHLRALYERIEQMLEHDSKSPCELVLATNSTTEGDTTALYIERIFEPIVRRYPVLKISRLGRGLSLGTELEYVDEVTIHNALKNRK